MDVKCEGGNTLNEERGRGRGHAQRRKSERIKSRRGSKDKMKVRRTRKGKER